MDQDNFQTTVENNQQQSRPKIIKKYGNRKLYDTQQSSYVILKDIEKMIRNNEKICVIDNETQDDITIPTLTQIIFGAEKKSNISAPVDVLQKIIKDGDGSFSSYLANLGLFKAEEKVPLSPKVSKPKEPQTVKKNLSEDAGSAEEKLAKSLSADESSTSNSQEESIPQLPGSHLES